MIACRVLLVCVVLTGPLAAASPRNELLRYVPEDVGFCLVVQDLRGRLRDLAASPFAERWAKTAVAKRIVASPEWQQLRQVEQYLSKHLGVPFEDVRNDILGHAVVLAFRPGPPGSPDKDQGLLLVRAGSAKMLADYVDKINALQKDTGELKAIDDVEHNGVTYHRRREAKSTNYYVLRGPVLLFTGQEAFLKEALDAERKAAEEPALAKRLRDLKLEQATVALAVNPRALDASVTAKADDPGARMFVACWKALQGVGVALDVGADAKVRLAVRVNTKELPLALRKFLSSATKASDVWGGFPEDALLAAGGRLDLAALYEFLGECMSKPQREAADVELARSIGAALGKDVVKELLPAFGPDWGVCVTAPAEGKGWAPGVVLALKLARGDEADPLDETVLSAVQSWARVAVLAHNKLHADKTLALKSQVVDRVRVSYLQGDGVFPAGVQPAVALKGGYLVLASSPAEVRRFKGGAAVSGDGVPLLRVSVKAGRAYFDRHRDAVVVGLIDKDGLTKAEAEGRFADVRSLLELVDRVELRQASGGGLVTFTLAVDPAVALRK